MSMLIACNSSSQMENEDQQEDAEEEKAPITSLERKNELIEKFGASKARRCRPFVPFVFFLSNFFFFYNPVNYILTDKFIPNKPTL
jgi:hypothetical protein